ncbi:MAG: hypothetical protein R6U46_12190, partial [Marinilabilia sp.]
MQKSIKRSLLLIFIALAASLTGIAQSRFSLTEGMDLTVRGGYNLFFGDLVDKSRGSYSAGILADRELTRILSARAQLTGGTMQGSQIMSDRVYAEFDNMYAEFSLGGAYRPLNHILGYFKQRTFQPYGHMNTGIV